MMPDRMIFRVRNIVCVVALAFTLSACEGVVSESTILPASESGPEYAAHESYLLGPGDRVRIGVFGEADLTGEYAVNPAGNIDYALVGEIKASGRPLKAIETDIVARLRKGYLRDPKVSIDIVTYRPFFITGEVRNGGQFPYKPNLTVQEAVAIAGGYTYRANTKFVLLRRAGQNEERAFETQSRKILIYPGDQIRIAERFF
jgi:protein involved in polysaccharide export with SLBB domain